MAGDRCRCWSRWDHAADVTRCVLSQERNRGDPPDAKAGRLHWRLWTPAKSAEASRYPLGVGSKSGNNLPIFSGMSERALRVEPAVTVECLSCRHVGVLTGAALSRHKVVGCIHLSLDVTPRR
jgi:hypothetical protein